MNKFARNWIRMAAWLIATILELLYDESVEPQWHLNYIQKLLHFYYACGGPDRAKMAPDGDYSYWP